MGGYPPGYDIDTHSDLAPADAAISIVESRWKLMEASRKQKMIEEYTEMIVKMRKEILEHSRKMHPSGLDS